MNKFASVMAVFGVGYAVSSTGPYQEWIEESQAAGENAGRTGFVHSSFVDQEAERGAHRRAVAFADNELSRPATTLCCS